MNHVQIFKVCKIWITSVNLKNNSRPTGRIYCRAHLHSTALPAGTASRDSRWPTYTVTSTAHRTSDGVRPMRRQGRVGARSRGSDGRPDSGTGRQRGGSGTMARTTRLHGELDWGISGRSGSPKRGGGPEEWRVAPVVRLVGTGASWRSSRMQRRHWMRTRGGRWWEALRR
jgi:hypothetical protein